MKRKFPIVPAVIAGVVALAALAFIITAVGGGDEGEEALSASGVEQTRPVAVEGTALPAHDASVVPDPAAGMQAPVLEGLSFDGTPVAIRDDGRAKVIVFLAHWCPHCQAEVPVITRWLADRGDPEDVDLYAVSTGVAANQPNHPPSAWLEQERWPVPTLADDADSSGAAAYGLTAYPYFVGVGADGTIVMRGTGELEPEQLDALVDAVASA